jgi:hypothetical protein
LGHVIIGDIIIGIIGTVAPTAAKVSFPWQSGCRFQEGM